MNRLIVFLGLLLACVLPCAAQKASGPFADVPPNSWPFVAQDTIKGAGISFGYPDRTYGGRRATTRYEFAVATARTLENAEPSTWSEHATLRTDVPIKLQASPLAVSSLIALANEFRPELNRMEPNALKETAQLIALQQQQRQDVYDGKIVLTPEQLASPFADVPRTAEAWHLTDTLLKAGLVGVGMPPVSDWPSSTFGWLPLTRLQMAQSLLRLVSNKDEVPDISMRLQKSPKAITALQALTAEFTPELKLLGVNMAVYQAQLNDLAAHKPMPLTDHYFSDVPLGHWAWQAVETLRQNGILAGYPNGQVMVMPNERGISR